VAKDGVHGLAVEPGDLRSAIFALDRLLGDVELRERLGRNAAALAAGSPGRKTRAASRRCSSGALSRFARPQGHAAFTSRREPSLDEMMIRPLAR